MARSSPTATTPRATSTSRSASARRSSTTPAQLADDTNGLNSPLTRRGVVPFGDDKAGAAERAVARDRPPLPRGRVARSATSSQDQPTLQKAKKTDARLLDGAGRGLRRGAGEARVRQGAVGRPPEACSAKALKGAGDARHVRRRVPAEHRATSSTARAAQIQTSWTNAQLSVSVGVKADDGMNLSRLEQRFGRHAGRPARPTPRSTR